MKTRNRRASRSRGWLCRSTWCVTAVLLIVLGSFAIVPAGAQDGDGGQTDPPTDAGDGGGGETDGGGDVEGGGQEGGDPASTDAGGGTSRPAVSGWALGLAALLVLVAIVIVLQRGSSRPRRPKPDNLYDSYDTPLARTEAPMPSNPTGPTEPPAAQG